MERAGNFHQRDSSIAYRSFQCWELLIKWMYISVHLDRFMMLWRMTTWTWCGSYCLMALTPRWQHTLAVACSRWPTVTAWSASSLVRDFSILSFSQVIHSSPHCHLAPPSEPYLSVRIKIEICGFESRYKCQGQIFFPYIQSSGSSRFWTSGWFCCFLAKSKVRTWGLETSVEIRISLPKWC